MTDTRLAAFWHSACYRHYPGHGIFEHPTSGLVWHPEPHPDTVERVMNIQAILEAGPIRDRLDWHMGRYATEDELATFHTREHIAAMKKACGIPGSRVDAGGTGVNPGSWDAALAAAGTALDAMDAVLSTPSRPAFAIVRPPGHHAQPHQPDGNCLFNNLALAVLKARASGIERVAVIDWDVHHGNGTQAGFYDRDDVLTISIHMDHGSWSPAFHPETGAADEVGVGAGKGFNRNIPLAFGLGNTAYDRVLTELVTPLIDDFKPGLIVIAAGEDANAYDPNGRMLLTQRGYRSMALKVREMAARHAGGRLLMVQEGGYSPTYTAYCAYGMVEGAMGIAEATIADPLDFYPERTDWIDGEIAKVRAGWDTGMAA